MCKVNSKKGKKPVKYKNVMILQPVDDDIYYRFYTGWIKEVRDNGDYVVDVSWLNHDIISNVQVIAKEVIKWEMKDSFKSFFYGIMTPSLWVFMIFGGNGQNTLIRSEYYLTRVLNKEKRKK